LNGILTEKQLKEVLQALEDEGLKILTYPKITTLSGRAARVEIEPGPSASLLATVEPDGKTINLAAEVEVPGDEKRKLSAVKVGTQGRIWDGQTLAFSAAHRKGESIILLVTPTIIDPAGNRVNAPGSLPEKPPGR
jgi:hypothetical protein